MLEYLYPVRTYLIVSGVEKPNVMAADWVVPLSFQPPLIGVSVGHTRYTHNLIKEHKEYVVAVPTIEMLKEIWVAGTQSGPEKIKNMRITFVKSKKVKVPSIKECQANLECKVVKEVDVGDHTLFIGEVVDVSYGDAFRGYKPDIKNYRFVMHVSLGRDFTTNSSELFSP